MSEYRDVIAKIVAWHENYPPGIVRCLLRDRLGRDWFLTLKQVYVTDADLSETSNYPLPGTIRCKVLATKAADNGREFATVEIDPPVTNLTVDGADTFEVWTDQLIEHPGH
ncbi:MAG: hypothetical protein ISS15_10240 [Alphaproteobacteria bacterium]|nr:hypothetical protein [Alphaproteobacteria bacterium]MBL6938615.1 hypothetical protein [Alphaproteobacteria bacterium]MBL7098028.1 hypothetical protein [Alphaproteobacteria bacterium]